MELITREQFAQLLINGEAIKADPETDLKPVIKLDNFVNAESWLIASVDPDDPDTAFGLYYLGTGQPELKNISIEELVNFKHPLQGAEIKRDTSWTAKKSLNEYASDIS